MLKIRQLYIIIPIYFFCIMGNSISVHRSFAHDLSELDEIWCVGSPGGHMYPKGISPKLLIWLPRNGLLNILLFVIFALPMIIQSIITWTFFILLKNRFPHFKTQRISFHLVYLMASFDDTDNYPRLLIFDL